MGDSGHGRFFSIPELQEDELQISTSADVETWRGPRSIPGLVVPSVQKAVITPEVTTALGLVVSTVPVREPLPHEVVVRMCYTGICRSDACFATGPLPGYPATDHIAGHEGIGQVVTAHRPELLGRFVGLRYLGSTCGSCAYCLDGLPTSCPDQLNTPKQISGSFQEYATVPVDCLVHLPDHLVGRAPDLSALCGALCSGSAALMAVRAAHIHAQSVVVVVGAGGAIGHYAGMIAKNIFGAKVIGVDLMSKVDMMKERGCADYADVVLLAPADDASSESWNLFTHTLVETCTQLRADKTTKRAADALIVAGSSAAAFRRLEGYVRDGGWIVCSGVPPGLQLSLSIHDVVERNLHVTGCLMGSHAVSLDVMRYICDGQIRPVTTHVSMEDIPEKMKDLVACNSLGKIVTRIQEPLDLSQVKAM